jgi:hypothetical protein
MDIPSASVLNETWPLFCLETRGNVRLFFRCLLRLALAAIEEAGN